MAIVFEWRPTTLQYELKYLAVAYADDLNGTGFTFDRTSKTHFGLSNSTSVTPSTNPADYKWFSVLATSNGTYTDFGTTGNDAKYLAYTNRGSRLFSFNISLGAYSGAFVPTDPQFDQHIWSALADDANPANLIDLDIGTGQVTQVGITTNNVASGQLSVENTINGQLKVSMNKIFDFAGGTFTGSASTITIDETGRVIGFDSPDDLFMTIDNFTATSAQTVFTPTTRAAGYFTGQDLIFQNGILLTPTSDYTETSSTFTLNTGAITGDRITCISFRAVSSKKVFIDTGLTISSISGANVYWNSGQMPYQLIEAGDEFTFDNISSATVYTVSSVDYTNKYVTFTASVTATVGDVFYNHRDTNDSYRVFSRFDDNLVGASTYTPTDYNIHNGYENLFLNGSAFNDQDYEVFGGSVIDLPATLTGDITNIQLNSNNFSLPCGLPINVVTYFVNGQNTYTFSSTSGGLNIYANGVLYIINSDYTATTSNFTLTTTPDNSLTIMNQQSFARAGAA